MNYYNEFDPQAAQWLRNLIKHKLIPDGIVDTRSICDVVPADLMGFTQCHFFAGIGGWSLALDLAGWPRDRPVWTGSCPCQPFSTAGRQKGVEDERHLWPVFLDLIAQCRPQRVFGEQVASAIGHGWLDLVSSDLDREGYACGAAVLGAHSVGAPHLRQRLYWVASALADASHDGQQRGDMGSQAGEGREAQGGGEDEGSRRDDAPDGGGANSGLADTCSQRLQGSPADAGGADEAADSGERQLQSQRHGAACGLADSNGQRCEGEPVPVRQGRREAAEVGRCGSTGVALGDTIGEGLQGRQLDASEQAGRQRPVPGSDGALGGWDRVVWHPCRDGKSRPVPAQSPLLGLADGLPAGVVRVCPDSFPLTAKKEPNRVARLKGYGNAIVPQVAAAFIRASKD